MHQCIRPGFWLFIRNHKKESVPSLHSRDTCNSGGLGWYICLSGNVKANTSRFLTLHSTFQGWEILFSSQALRCWWKLLSEPRRSVACPYQGKKDVKVSVMKWFAFFFPLTWHKMQIDVRWGFIFSSLTLEGLTGDIHPIGAAWVHGTRRAQCSDVKQTHLSGFWYVYLLKLSSLFHDFIMRGECQPVIADNY